MVHDCSQYEQRIPAPRPTERRSTRFVVRDPRVSSTLNAMPGYEDRASILQGAGDMIFQLVCERATQDQWAAWLRAPLEHAAGTGDHELVDRLLKAGADGSAGWRGCDGKTLLHAGAEGGDNLVMTTLIRGGARADMKAKVPGTGRTPLHVAALSGKEAAAKALMMAGANVNTIDARKDAPLHLAIEAGHVRLAGDLLLSGADHDARGSKGCHPIYLAAERGQDEVVLALAQRGANMNCLKDQWWTPLTSAVRQGRVSTVAVLLAGGADVNFKSSVELTALHIAAQFNETWAIPALVKAGADYEAKNSVGSTPLFLSVYSGACSAMLALMQLGAKVNAKNDYGKTPLHLACRYGHAVAADLLLRWGADETIVDNNGKTPSQRIPSIARAAEQDRPRFERLSKLLTHAPQDRTWRRRGFVVMCRAHPGRLRLVVEIPDTLAQAVGHPQERPSRRARRGQVKVEIRGAHGGGGGAESVGSNSRCAVRRAGAEGTSGGFDGVAAWLIGLQDDEVFRNIVGFL